MQPPPAWVAGCADEVQPGVLLEANLFDRQLSLDSYLPKMLQLLICERSSPCGGGRLNIIQSALWPSPRRVYDARSDHGGGRR